MSERNLPIDPSSAGAGIAFADEVRRMAEASPSHKAAVNNSHIDRVASEPTRVGEGTARSPCEASHAAMAPQQRSPSAKIALPRQQTIARDGRRPGAGRSGPSGEQACIPPRYRRQHSRSSSGWCPWARARCGDVGALLSSCFACGSSGADAANTGDKTAQRLSSRERRPSECSSPSAGKLQPKFAVVEVVCKQSAPTVLESALSSSCCTSSAVDPIAFENHVRTGLDVDISAISEIKEAEVKIGALTPYFGDQGAVDFLERLRVELASKISKVNDEPSVDPGLPPLKPPKVPEDSFCIGTAVGYSDDSVSRCEPEKPNAALARQLDGPATDKDHHLAAEIPERCRAICTSDTLEALDDRRQRDLMLLLPGCKPLKSFDSDQGNFAHPVLSLSDALVLKRKAPSEAAASLARSRCSTSSGPTCDSSTTSNCSSDSEANTRGAQSFERTSEVLSSPCITDSGGSDSAKSYHSARRLPDMAAPKHEETPSVDGRKFSECSSRSPMGSLKSELLRAHERQQFAFAAIADVTPRRQISASAPKLLTPDRTALSKDVSVLEIDQELRPPGRRARLKTTGKPPARRASMPATRPVQACSSSNNRPSRHLEPPATKYGVGRRQLPDAPEFAVKLSSSEDSLSFGYGSSDSGVQDAARRSPSLPPRRSGKALSSNANARARSSDARQHEPTFQGCSRRGRGPQRPVVAPLAPWEEPTPTRSVGKRRGSKPRSRRPQRCSRDSSSGDPGSGTPREARYPSFSEDV